MRLPHRLHCSGPGVSAIHGGKYLITLYLSVLETENEKLVFHNMYDKYNAVVYNTALKILRSQHDAEDAAHGMWLKVIRNFKKVSALPENRLLPYLIVAAKNCSLDIIAKQKKLSPISDEILQFYAEKQAPPPDVHDVLHVGSYISSLPPIYRRVLDLKYITGMKNREIAEYLNISQSAVESRIKRGKQMLKKQIIKEGMEINNI